MPIKKPINSDHLRVWERPDYARGAVCAILPRMNRATLLVAAALVLLPLAASAQPVGFQLKNDVAAGAKPTLSLQGVEKMTDLKIELTRDDGEKFSMAVPKLNPGELKVLPIGDGKPGKAHYEGILSGTVVGEGPWSFDLKFDTLIRAPMTINYDYEHLDLANHVLKFAQSRAAGHAELTVIGEDGTEIGHGEAKYNKEPPGTWLAIPWKEDKPGRVMMLKLHTIAADGLGAFAELIPWQVQIDHEDVNFDTDSAVVKPSEAGKLDASLRKIDDIVKKSERFVKVKLYVAGHTDTVGSADHNRKLSHDRARSIAEYFHKKGLKIPIVFDGFGEDMPKVPTPDNTDEPRNRRADYVLGAIGAQPPAGYRGADWKPIK